MLRRLTPERGDERGASMITIAIAMVVILGMAAVAIESGAAFIERRQDQTAVDIAAMAGILDFADGEAAVRDQVLAFVEANIEGADLTPAEWVAAWAGCSDPTKNDGGFDFDPVAAPAAPGWGSEIDCISIDDAGYVRVRVPDQVVDTTFGRVLGFDSLLTHAAAVSRTVTHAGGDILPFAVLGGATSVHYCLRSDAGGPGGGGGGGVPDPCDGPDTGNFGTIDSPLFGDLVLETDEVCSQTAQFRVLATNIALGLDHPIYKNGPPLSGSIADNCGNLGINALWTDQGMGQGTEQGLINGTPGVSGDFHSLLAIPLLQQSHNTRSVAGEMLNDKPLWEFLLPNGAGYDGPVVDGLPDNPVSYGVNAPAICNPTMFDGGMSDWDGDGNDDQNRSWKHMRACLEAYVSGPYTHQIFAGGGEIFSGVPSINTSSRFNYVPQFWETTFPPGASELRNLKVFRAVYIQGTWFGSGANQKDFHPGEGPEENWSGSLRQVSSFLLPDSTLPLPLRGEPSPFGESTNTVSLFR